MHKLAGQSRYKLLQCALKLTSTGNPQLWCLFSLTVRNNKTDGELPTLCSDKAVKPNSLASSARMVCSEYGPQSARGDAVRKDAAVSAVEWPGGVGDSRSDPVWTRGECRWRRIWRPVFQLQCRKQQYFETSSRSPGKSYQRCQVSSQTWQSRVYQGGTPVLSLPDSSWDPDATEAGHPHRLSVYVRPAPLFLSYLDQEVLSQVSCYSVLKSVCFGMAQISCYI